ncbi:MAG: hypothetical protein A2622_05345 [Bdellovibrionales bacterium RIFCSPHIGHO2_01_FULL_40_29]|nr:MAG: hypothetical protein A2622_05345 [Bdellovibrionales bacterium RIFCSPHIGHO2_01_FULL_40_29]OFZ34652.1 MAG: hypothetical protein A3D17_10030 [Bdellovibrionales bacterium RIFCSPHIGHO2_02_FULL_40_15]
MTSRRILQIISVIFVISLVGVLFVKTNKPGPHTSVHHKNLDFSEGVVRLDSLPETIVRSRKGSIKKIQEVDISKCTGFIDPQKNYETILNQIKRNTSLQEQKLEMIEYQLLNQDSKEVIIQKNINKAPADQVRVFILSEDGFPTRVKTFPNSRRSLEKKLAGALSLGVVTKKIEKYQALGQSGEQLFIEIENRKITRINYIQNQIQLLCEENTCSCNQRDTKN